MPAGQPGRGPGPAAVAAGGRPAVRAVLLANVQEDLPVGQFHQLIFVATLLSGHRRPALPGTAVVVAEEREHAPWAQRHMGTSSRPVWSWIAPPGPGTLIRHRASPMSRARRVRSIGSDQVRPLSSLERAKLATSSVPGRASALPRPGLQRM